jgi:hypothetical protein
MGVLFVGVMEDAEYSTFCPLNMANEDEVLSTLGLRIYFKMFCLPSSKVNPLHVILT